MKFQIIGLTLGALLFILGLAEMIPAVLDFSQGDPNWKVFFESSFITLFWGGCMMLSCRSGKLEMTKREAFFLTASSWIVLSFFAAIPFHMSDLRLSFADAVFETSSGITTTGSTVLSGLDDMSHGILLWRSIIQWIGGIGIIGFAIVFLPFLRIGGMQLFQTESSDRSEKIMPRTPLIVTYLLSIYVLLSCMICLTYKVLGMSWFDAVNHAMTTISTAGYSTHDASFGHFKSYSLDMAATLFMAMSGVPFILYVKAVFQGRFDFFKDEQFKVFVSILCVFTIILTLWLWNNSDYDLANSFRYSVFSIASVSSTTGYATTDYLAWGPFAVMFFLFLTCMGGAAGSTSGGIKTMRFIVAFKAVNAHIKKLIYPHSVSVIRYQGKPLDDRTVMNILTFIGIYLISIAFFSLLIAWTGVDMSTAISAAATSISSTGPGIGDVIGPSGNFSAMPEVSKWILSLCMIVGRLEIMTMLILFTPDFWTN